MDGAPKLCCLLMLYLLLNANFNSQLNDSYLKAGLSFQIRCRRFDQEMVVAKVLQLIGHSTSFSSYLLIFDNLASSFAAVHRDQLQSNLFVYVDMDMRKVKVGSAHCVQSFYLHIDGRSARHYCFDGRNIT